MQSSQSAGVDVEHHHHDVDVGPDDVSIPYPFKLLSRASLPGTDASSASSSQLAQFQTARTPPCNTGPAYGSMSHQPPLRGFPTGMGASPPAMAAPFSRIAEAQGTSQKVMALRRIVVQKSAIEGRTFPLRHMSGSQATELMLHLGTHPVLDVKQANEDFVRTLMNSNGAKQANFDRVVHANAITGDSEMTGFFLGWMLAAEFNPGQATLHVLIQLFDGFSKQWMLLDNMACMGVSSSHGWNRLIDACVKAGDMDRAEEWVVTLRLAQGTPFWPTDVTYNTVIHAYARLGKAPLAQRWLEHMIEDNLEPSHCTVGSIVNAYASEGKFIEAEECLEYTMRVTLLKPNTVIFNCLMKACTRAGEYARAEFWYHRMKSAGDRGNAATYNLMISACVQMRDFEKAESYFYESVQAGEEQNAIIYNTLVNACATCGKTDRAKMWIQQMQEHGFTPDAATYGSLCKAYAHDGQYKEVEAVISSLDRTGIPHNEYFYASWLNACAKSRKRAKSEAERAFRQCISRGLEGKKVISLLRFAVGRERAAQLSAELCGGDRRQN